jgi:predicted translin family RNA/ssDNA-binding protein
MRETLIKKCRDGQKAAKQAIYALHREDFEKAKKLIANCEKSILEDLNPIVRQDSQLRFGSFASVLEEYAEAKLFYVWLAGDDGSTDEGISSGKASGKLLQSSDFTAIPLEVEEYLGGLADLTGEVGRYAVKKGTMRDTESVKLSLETCMSILYAFEGLIKIPGGGIQKKLDQLKRTVEKLEKMLYELSLSEATGRTITAALTESMPN